MQKPKKSLRWKSNIRETKVGVQFPYIEKDKKKYKTNTKCAKLDVSFHQAIWPGK